MNYIFTGKGFKHRMRILPENKGKIAMKKDIFVTLKDIGDELDGRGFSKSASVITSSMKNLLNVIMMKEDMLNRLLELKINTMLYMMRKQLRY